MKNTKNMIVRMQFTSCAQFGNIAQTVYWSTKHVGRFELICRALFVGAVAKLGHVANAVDRTTFFAARVNIVGWTVVAQTNKQQKPLRKNRTTAESSTYPSQKSSTSHGNLAR